MQVTEGTRIAGLTALALTAFAANSLLCRAALGAGAIDPVAFTVVRLAAGALALAPIARRVEPDAAGAGPGWRGPAALFTYAIAFSLAYVTLDTGTGALLLFGAVQVTMIGAGLASGERVAPLQWVGAAAAVAGLVVLVAPGLSAPSPAGAALMLIAGAAWGIYTLGGRGVTTPVTATRRNFTASLALALPVGAIAVAVGGVPVATPVGIGLAAASGAVASGVGYALWFAALRGHTATSAAIVQLAVPVLAAAGGIALLGESASARLGIAAVLTLGGIGLAIAGRPRAR